MSKRSRTSRPASKKAKRRSSTASSLAIPIVVGVAVVAIIVFAILSLENRQPVAAAVPGDISVPIVTAQPRPTTQIPYPDVPRVSVTDMKAMMDSGEGILVDVRSKAAYDQSHAAGAISIPEEEMSARMNELPRDKDVVLYCT